MSNNNDDEILMNCDGCSYHSRDISRQESCVARDDSNMEDVTFCSSITNMDDCRGNDRCNVEINDSIYRSDQSCGKYVKRNSSGELSFCEPCSSFTTETSCNGENHCSWSEGICSPTNTDANSIGNECTLYGCPDECKFPYNEVAFKGNFIQNNPDYFGDSGYIQTELTKEERDANHPNTFLGNVKVEPANSLSLLKTKSDSILIDKTTKNNLDF